MNINHMKAFLEVASNGNFQIAAENLYITQSTVSARIKALEDQLNTQLFIRKRDGSELTSAGRNFIRYATSAVRAWEQAKLEVALPDELDGMIALGVQMNLWQQITPQWLERLKTNAPEIGTRVVMDYSDSLLTQLSDGILDLTLTYIPRQQADITSEKLLEDSLVLVATKPRKVHTDWVEDYVFVDWGTEFREEHKRAYPGTQAPRLSVGLGMVGLDYILKYGGAGYFPERMVEDLVQKGRLFYVEDAPKFSRPVYLSYRKESASEEANKLLEIAKINLNEVVNSAYC